MPASETGASAQPSGRRGARGSSKATTGRGGRRRRLRLIVIGLAFLLVVGLGAGTYWSISTVRDSFPQTTGSVKVPGMSAPATVKRDGSGIPQIYASTPEDLFRAQGYVQAQDRFWEMDVRRHMTAGRLSEMFGKSQVDTDKFLRTLGWRHIAQKEYDTKLSASTKNYLKAYSDGVNGYLKDHKGSALSVEYAALGFTNDYEPGKWTPVDSVAWLKAMAWDLRANMEDEIDRSLLTSRFSEKQIADMYPSYPYKRNRPIVDGGSVRDKTFRPSGGTSTQAAAASTESPAAATEDARTQMSEVRKKLEEIPAALGTNGNGIGSNSWVVDGAHTTTGKPLLANDPHLSASLPGVWYQMGLHCKTVSKACPYDVSGFTFSGMPGVVIGHNDKISWGMTNLGADVSDLYLEKITGEGRYDSGDGEKEFRTRKETIKVAGGDDVEITVRSTDNGPLISDRGGEPEDVGERAPVDASAPDRGDGYGVALRWTALEPSNTMDAVFGMNKAQDFKQFRAASRDFAVPSQNLIYADTAGNIGYQAPGRIPIRGKGDGTMPAPGWDPDYRWKGYIPQSALPYEYNPERGYIVTANQAVIDPDNYPYLITKDPGYGTRSERINNLIESKTRDGGKISPDDMQTMQMDSSSEIGRELTPLLLKLDIKDPYVKEAQDLLKDWDFKQDSDSAAAAYFNGVWRHVLKLAFGDKMPKELRVEDECLNVRRADSELNPDDSTMVRECGERAPEDAQPDGGDRWIEVIRGLIDDKHEKSEWWRTPETRQGRDDSTDTRDELLAKAMKNARWELTSKLGKDVSTWTWGRLHQLTLKNQTLGKEGPGMIQWLLNRGPWNLSGGEAAVNAAGWNAAGGYEVVWVPSMRMVVNLDNLDKSRWINLTGASGHAYSEHYTDQTPKWARGEMLDWPSSKTGVNDATEATMSLTP
ncbi:penicillin acylase family protein [Streptomyces sp. A7024]|uniref:Penicillin acylase family protein n=1 Tax=Streptomyces coryli TaxID=1128680 RepID=A0A6G4TZF6_9ACTN|nr:penicillin acylase family protein [Streptomyces coryli]NGN64371.1 penicillin acylase family protein [Streptomyces coryli]